MQKRHFRQYVCVFVGVYLFAITATPFNLELEHSTGPIPTVLINPSETVVDSDECP